MQLPNSPESMVNGVKSISALPLWSIRTAARPDIAHDPKVLRWPKGVQGGEAALFD